MNAGKAVYGILSTNTGVTDIVSTRIYPEIAEQEAPVPFIVYQVQNVAPEDTHDGPSTLDEVRFEFLCYDATYNGAAELGDKVRGALDRVQGTYNTVNVQSVQFNDVDTEIIDEPRRYAQILTFTFRIARDNFEIAQGTPVTGAMLGDLYDVNTTGVTDGQVIAYDAATSVWLPATDAGGAEQLNDLSDVIISQPESGDFFRYDGDEWVNDTAQKSDVGLGNVDNTSDANKPVSTATQTALDLKADITSVPTDLDDLNDVQIIGTPTLGQALVYGAGKWLPGAAGATTLGALDDVNTTGAGVGSLLTYNGASWDISGSELPSDDIYFHQRYETESEALRSGATATVELYFTCTAQGNGLAESASSDTPTAGKIIKRKIYYSEEGFADPDTATWVQFSTLADDITFANAKAAILENLKLRTGGTVPISLKQTWEEVAAAPAFTGLLNETYGSGAEAAYSTRRLNGNVTDCMVIRRASDSTTTTIGFDGSGNIDEAAITTFCTGTTCTVYQWLDQSTNDNHATAAGTEPIIYTGGEIVRNEGRAAVDFQNAFSPLIYTGQDLNLSAITGTLVGRETYQSGSQGWGIVMQSDNNDGFRTHYQGSSVRNRTTGTNLDVIINQSFLSERFLHDIASSPSLIKSTFNGVKTATGGGKTFSTNGLDLAVGGSSYSATQFRGNINEAILFGVDKYTSGDIASIRENVGDYFTQNTPLLDTYTGAAAAYSLRLLRTAYTGDAVEVYNGSSYADIGFNVFGELDTVALAAHCGASDGFVSKWYDQSGNTNTAAQTTTSNMPKIYDGTTGVVTENGKPAMTGGNLINTFSSAISQPISIYSVHTETTGTNYYYTGITGKIDLYGSGGVYQQQADTGNIVGPSRSPLFNVQILMLNLYYGANSLIGYNGGNNTTGTLDTNGTSGMNLRFGALERQEFIVFEADDTDRTGIENNVNTFYDIF